MDQRAEFLCFSRFATKCADLVPCVQRPTLICSEAMFLEFAGRHRRPSMAECQNCVPKSDVSVDATYDVAARIGSKGDHLVTVTREDGALVAATTLKSSSGDDVAGFLKAVSQRDGCPQDNNLTLNIDDRRVMATGATSPHEKKLADAVKARAAVQDLFHVMNNFGTFFDSHHPDFHCWTAVRFRDAARIRAAEMESKVDALLRHGDVKSTVQFNGETSTISLSQPLSQDTIDGWKESGLCHKHFSKSKDGKGVAAPYSLRSDLDMDDRFAIYEADFVEAMFQQSHTHCQGQQVACTQMVDGDCNGVVGRLNPGAVAVAGLPVILARSGWATMASRDKLVPADPSAVWSPATHRSTPRNEVGDCCGRFCSGSG